MVTHRSRENGITDSALLTRMAYPRAAASRRPRGHKSRVLKDIGDSRGALAAAENDLERLCLAPVVKQFGRLRFGLAGVERLQPSAHDVVIDAIEPIGETLAVTPPGGEALHDGDHEVRHNLGRCLTQVTAEGRATTGEPTAEEDAITRRFVSADAAHLPHINS